MMHAPLFESPLWGLARRGIVVAAFLSIGIAPLLVGLPVSGEDMPAEAVGLRWPIEYDRYARIPRKIRRKCGLETAIPQAIAESSEQVELLARDQPFDGTILEIVIRSIGEASDGLSQRRTVTLRGRLLRGDHVVGSFVTTRQAGETIADRYRNMFSGSCKKFAGAVERLVEDVDAFVARPSRSAEMGIPR